MTVVMFITRIIKNLMLRSVNFNTAEEYYFSF